MDSNNGPLVSEATALPTEPQPLSKSKNVAMPIFCSIGKVFLWLYGLKLDCVSREAVEHKQK